MSTDRASSPAARLANLRDLSLRLQSESDALANAAAANLGLNRSDFACLRVLISDGPCTAGKLADATGLTTGAVTGVLDRLEKAEFVARDSDPDDRRRVIAVVRDEHRDRLAALLAPSWDASVFADAAFTDAELRVLSRFTQHQLESVRRETGRLRSARAASQLLPDAAGVMTVPLASARAAVLEIVGGIMDLEVACADDDATLVRAEFATPSIRMSERDGHVRIGSRARYATEPATGKLFLTASTPWKFRVSGGANRLALALEKIAVASVEVLGGESTLDFSLGEPTRPLSFYVRGGANKIAIRRSPGVPVEVSVRGGVAHLSAGGVDHGALTNATWTSTPTTGSQPAIRIAVRGGMNRITLTEA
jgi:DNA-binding MarR family transcriptional regulator